MIENLDASPSSSEPAGATKGDFSLGHSELRESQHTKRTGSFHANNAEEIKEEITIAIANLVNATLADRDTITAMQETITTLTL